MDTNHMICPTCGHSASNAAGACAYCGTTMVEEVQQPPDEDKKDGEKTQVEASPPPLPQKGIPPTDIIPEDETTPAVDNIITIDRQEIQADTAAGDFQSPVELEAVELAGHETGESEIFEEMIADMVEPEAAQQESESPSTLEKSPIWEKSAENPASKPLEDIQPKNDAEITVDAKAESATESLGDTILLELSDEVEPAVGELPDMNEKSAKSESVAETQKENRQKADLAKAQALKNQKAALAKAQAQKKQKLAQAKAATLKRKKAAQAKAQTEIEAAKRKVSVVAETAKPELDTGMATGTGMPSILEKYKGRVIGINYDNSADIREAQLVEANAEYFSVFVKDQKLRFSYPINAVLTVIESKDGVDIRGSKQSKKFSAVIKVYPLVLF